MKNTILFSVPGNSSTSVSFTFLPFMHKKEISKYKSLSKVYGRLFVLNGPLQLFCLKVYRGQAEKILKAQPI